MSLEVVECALAEAREFDGAVFPLTLGPKQPCALEDLCACGASFQLHTQFSASMPFCTFINLMHLAHSIHFSYLKQNRQATAAQLLKHGAILFRGTTFCVVLYCERPSDYRQDFL